MKNNEMFRRCSRKWIHEGNPTASLNKSWTACSSHYPRHGEMKRLFVVRARTILKKKEERKQRVSNHQVPKETDSPDIIDGQIQLSNGKQTAAQHRPSNKDLNILLAFDFASWGMSKYKNTTLEGSFSAVSQPIYEINS